MKELRAQSIQTMETLNQFNFHAIIHGSIARGDVTEKSDIDIFIPRPPSPILIEAIIERSGIISKEREIVQATPSYAAKGYIYVGERRSYSFSMVDPRPVELEFYGFAGSVDASQVEKGIRVPGVDKRLMLIEPTESGHIESPVTGREGKIAGILGINVAVVLDRVRTLTRREEIGRTGVFLNRKLAPDEGFGEVFQELARQRPALRRRLRM